MEDSELPLKPVKRLLLKIYSGCIVGHSEIIQMCKYLAENRFSSQYPESGL
jgi:hypothetical protein